LLEREDFQKKDIENDIDVENPVVELDEM